MKFAALAALLLSLSASPLPAGPQPATPPLPDVRQFIRDVHEHQKDVDKLRENYTYTSFQTMQDVDSSGHVKKTVTTEAENFFVNGHLIDRKVKKDGRQLSSDEEHKETQRVTRLVQKAEKTPRDQPLEGQTITIVRLLEIMDVSNERRQNFRGRPTIVFDFSGRKDAKTHGLLEDMSKKIRGSIWIDESMRQVVHLEATFTDNFRVAGGVVASIQKGTSVQFDQGLVNGELWLPTGFEANLAARVLLLKGVRQHMVERDAGYRRFRVDAEPQKDVKIAPARK